MDVIRADSFAPFVIFILFIIINTIATILKKGNKAQGKRQIPKSKAKVTEQLPPLIIPTKPVKIKKQAPRNMPKSLYEEIATALSENIVKPEITIEKVNEKPPKEYVRETVIEKMADEEALIRKNEYLPVDITKTPQKKKKKKASHAHFDFGKEGLKRAMLLYEILGPCKAKTI